jgi:hypothetical protein
MEGRRNHPPNPINSKASERTYPLEYEKSRRDTGLAELLGRETYVQPALTPVYSVARHYAACSTDVEREERC